MDYKYRSRNHLLVLYPQDTQNNHWGALQYICDNYDYAYCIHDMDTLEDGSPAKPHAHIVLRFPTAVWNTSLAKELDIEPRLFEQCKNFNKSLRYLVHADNKDKYQYDYELIEGTLRDTAIKLLNQDRHSEDFRAMEIFDFIDCCKRTVTFTEVFKECCSRGLYSDLRRMGSLLGKLIDEHNARYFSIDDF